MYNYGVFGRWLRPKMQNQGLTQKQLGDLVGLRQQAVSRWLADDAVPEARSVRPLAVALDVASDEVLEQIELHEAERAQRVLDVFAEESEASAEEWARQVGLPNRARQSTPSRPKRQRGASGGS